MAGSFVGASTATALSMGTGTLIFKIRHKRWLKDNARKYIINRVGRVEKLPRAFIGCGTMINPISLIILVNVYFFLQAYNKKKDELERLESEISSKKRA